ncbi:MAG: hypothetical protein HY354_07340, partial [Planctomycetes bacterium]|nr:hypothetical protein [Planctomycetota bacterium]
MKNYYKTLIICFTLVSALFLELDAFAATLPFAKGEHPRIFITKAEIPALAAKVDEPTDPLYPRYMTMKQEVDSAISNNWSWQYIQGPTSESARVRVVSAAFVYLIESYLHPDSSSFYVNGVKQVLENTNPNDYIGYQNSSFALAYDWIYNGLSPQDRITLGNKLVTSSYAIQRDVNDPADYNEWWKGRPSDDWHTMMSNLPSEEWTFAAIVIWNETSLNGNADNSLAQTKLNQIKTFLTTKKIPFTNMVGGGVNPDGGYDNIGTRLFALEIYAWDKATGENLWSTSRYLQDNLITRLFAWKMYVDRWVPFGMLSYEHYAFTGWYPIEVLSQKDTTGVAQYIANDLFKKPIVEPWYNNCEQYRWIIFYDPSKPGTNYNTLPLAFYAQGYNADGTAPIQGLDAGWVFFRSGWTKNDTLVAFTSGDWFTSKQVYNVNAFSIYRSGDLAIMNNNNQGSGGKDSVTGSWVNYTFQMNYGKPTVAVNSVTVSDPSISMDQGQELYQYYSVHPDNAHPNYVYYDQNNPEAGDYVNEAINTILSSHYKGAQYFDRGDITKFETKNNYDYALGDGSKAYHPDRLTNFQRALTFLDKKYLVILDRITAA